MVLLGIIANVVLGTDSPPMGWRSWNCFGGDIDDQKMRNIIEAMVSKKRLVDGVNTSLLDLGYQHCGIDDGWQMCGAGVGGSFHTKNGDPIVNSSRFPNPKQLVSYGHSKGLLMGWYGNNCICRETSFPDVNKVYQGDSNFLLESDFDGIKLDNCGEFTNLTLWSNTISALNKRKKAILIENCHWGLTLPHYNKDGTLWCPFDLYRTSADVYAEWNSVLHNLFSTRQFQDPHKPLSQPGCWAYPDMLETGNFNDIHMGRSHFGAWAIVSSPLILGLDLLDHQKVDRVWETITNREVISINQQWAGHPGMFVRALTPASLQVRFVRPSPSGGCSGGLSGEWAYDAVKHQVGWTSSTGEKLCWDAQDGGALTLLPCDGSSNQYFEYHSASGGDPDYRQTFSNSNGNCVSVVGGGYDPAGHAHDIPGLVIGGCNAGDKTIEWSVYPANHSLAVNGSMCLKVSDSPADPKVAPVLIWAKPQPNDAMAVLAISNFKKPLPAFDIDLAWLNVSTAMQVRDVWNKSNLPLAKSSLPVPSGLVSYDSRFFLLQPQN